MEQESLSPSQDRTQFPQLTWKETVGDRDGASFMAMMGVATGHGTSQGQDRTPCHPDREMGGVVGPAKVHPHTNLALWGRLASVNSWVWCWTEPRKGRTLAISYGPSPCPGPTVLSPVRSQSPGPPLCPAVGAQSLGSNGVLLPVLPDSGAIMRWVVAVYGALGTL